MTHHGPWDAAIPLHCSKCERFFVALGEVAVEKSVCACGAPLLPRLQPRGLYELHPPELDDKRGTSNEPLEVDAGYGESHGNDPAHGGPSGPGDAPAELTDR